ncbi:EAL domain-containing protein [Halomonas salifodinae]|uniref:EAL domain-containing protein n=1 Tax=Halomonas salifodinae TaxID=438745 RepID=UPI0033A6394B
MSLRRLLSPLAFWLLLGGAGQALASHQTLVIAPGSPGHRQDAPLVQALIDEIEASGHHAEVAYLRHQGGRGLPAEQTLALARGMPSPRLVLLHDPAVAFYRRHADTLGATDVVAYGAFDPEHHDWLAERGIPRVDLGPALRRGLAWVAHLEQAPLALWAESESAATILSASVAGSLERAGHRLRWETLSRDALPWAERRLASGDVVRDVGFLVAPPSPEVRRRAEVLRRQGWRLWCLDPAWLEAGCLGGIIVDAAAVAGQLLDALDEEGGSVLAAPATPRVHYTQRQRAAGQGVAIFGMSEALAERQRRGGWFVGVAVGAGVLALVLLLAAGWAEVRRRRRRRQLQLDERTRLPEWPALAARMNRYLEQDYRFQLCWIGFDRLAQLEASEDLALANRLLPALAQRLRKLVGGQAYLARLEGGAFAVMTFFTDEAQARLFMERLQRGLNDSIELGGERHLLLPRLGVVESLGEGDSPPGLLQAAVCAAGRVLREGERRPCWFRPGELDAASQQAALLDELGRGVRHAAEQFQVRVTPFYRLGNRQLAGGSFQLEWRHSRWGVIAPATWRPLARMNQDILGVERYLLSVGLRQLSEQSPGPGLSWSFPISAQHLESPLFSDWLEARCEERGVPLGSVELCVDELALPPSDVALQSLHRLRELGVGLSIDGDQEGVELLALLRLPITVLRLPGALARGLPANQRALLLLKGIRETAVMLGVRVIVTGLDNADRLSSVRGLGYQWGSGPLLGDAEPLESLLRRQADSLTR